MSAPSACRNLEAAIAGWPGNAANYFALAQPARGHLGGHPPRRRRTGPGGHTAAACCQRLKTRVVNVIEKTCMLKQRPTVFCVEWIEPFMAAGNWVPELVELAGGANLAGEAGKHSPWADWDTLRNLDPERHHGDAVRF